MNQFSRSELLIGKSAMRQLNKSKVIIFGIGGVGSYVLEGLVRAGIENFILVDNDDVSITNINRQIIAMHSTVGMAKVDVAKNRAMDINPNVNIQVRKEFFTRESEELFDESINYIIDCIDTVTSKIEIIERANKLNIPIISCMGTGNKLNPIGFEIADINKTSVCPLAKVMRKELKNKGIKKLKVLYSKENPIKIDEKIMLEYKKENDEELNSKKMIPGSMSFVPSVAGLIIASEVVKDLIKDIRED